MMPAMFHNHTLTSEGAADGTNPFVFLKEAGLALSLVDAAKYTIQSQDVDMTFLNTFRWASMLCVVWLRSGEQ